MDREPIKLPEQEPTMAKPKNKFKPLAIVFIVLTVLFALAAGFFVWQWLDQKSQIETLKNDINEIQAKLDNKTSTKKDIITSPFNITEQEVWDIVNKQNIPLLESNGVDGQIEKKEITRVERVSFGFGDSQIAVIHIDLWMANGIPVQDGMVVALYRNNPNDVWKYGNYSIYRTILGMCDSFKDNFDFAKAAANELCIVPSEGGGPKSSSVLEYLGRDYFSENNQ